MCGLFSQNGHIRHAHRTSVKNIKLLPKRNGVYKKFLNFVNINIGYNNRMDREEQKSREAICSECPFRNIDTCEKNGMKLGEFIHLRLAWCPIFKWG